MAGRTDVTPLPDPAITRWALWCSVIAGCLVASMAVIGLGALAPIWTLPAIFAATLAGKPAASSPPCHPRLSVRS